MPEPFKLQASLFPKRLFEVIDKGRSDSIGYNEFLHGIAILFRGSRKEKLKFIFDLYDLSRSGSISHHELITMLHQFPESALELIKSKDEPAHLDGQSRNNAHDDIEALVNLAFPTPESANSRLTFEQFCEWCETTPGITDVRDHPSLCGLFSSLCVENTNNVNPGLTCELRTSQLLMSVLPAEEPPNSPVPPVDGRSCPRMNQLFDVSNRKDLEKTRQLLQEAKQTCGSIESVASKIQLALTEVEKMLVGVSSSSPVAATSGSSVRGKLMRMGSDSAGIDEFVCDGGETMVGDLWKRGSRLRQMIKRHYVLQGNFLYYYATRDDTAPRGVTFTCGCYVESLPQNVITEKNVKYYAIDIVPEPGNTRETRTIYTRSLEEQQKWTLALRRATDMVSIDEFYDIGAQLGCGRFSKVCEATHRATGAKHAVKIIDKAKLIATEKELLRTEIAILKLVTHANIIRLHDVYEDKQHIFIVTEFVSGGELFNRIVGRSRYTESEARIVMAPLLESVAYLHRLGIVHRDIEPENILCGEKLNDLKIADFGLSKLVHPEEIMKLPCGTLNYVAPEVLSLVGYGREADIWSVGVIMFLLLRGDLPFHDKTKNEIIQKTMNADVNLDSDPAWASISPTCKSLLKGLLTKVPTNRLTVQDALRHEWFHVRRGSESMTGTSRASMT
ncbi:Camk/camk1 protein kinase, partial [Globisporangium splendens]